MSQKSMSRNYRILCVSETMSPATHMSRTEGNEAIVAREEIATKAGKVGVPFLSGNAIRHRAIRAPGWRWVVDQYGLAGKLSLSQLNFLFHGGSLTEGGGREDTRRIADWQRIFPLGRLLGGCLPDQILKGSMKVGRGSLACRENHAVLGYLAPACGFFPGKLRSAEDFLTGYQYTRGDSRKTGMAPPSEDSTNSDSNLMIFAGQAVVRGAAFVHDFLIEHGSEVELGALLWSIRLWMGEGATVGGQSARGHGRLATSIVAPDFDADAAMGAYVDHALSQKEEGIAWLNAAFARKAAEVKEKPIKAVKGKAGKAKLEPEGEAEMSIAPDAPEVMPEVMPEVITRSAEPSLFGEDD